MHSIQIGLIILFHFLETSLLVVFSKAGFLVGMVVIWSSHVIILVLKINGKGKSDLELYVVH